MPSKIRLIKKEATLKNSKVNDFLQTLDSGIYSSTMNFISALNDFINLRKNYIKKRRK